MQRSYSIYETKAKLSEILRVVKSGKKVIVCERGTPIAEIIPFAGGELFKLTPQKLDQSCKDDLPLTYSKKKGSKSW